MAVTYDPITDGDFVLLNGAEVIGGWSVGGSMSKIAIANNGVQGTNNIQARVNTGTGFIANSTARNWTDTHIRIWLKLAQSINTVATPGASVGIGTNTNYGGWSTYGSERQVVVYNGWMMLAADPLQPFDFTGGTPPAITSAGSVIHLAWLNGNGKDLDVGDALFSGNFAVVRGGTTGARGLFSEIGTADEASGYGILRPVGGVFYLNAGLDFGDSVSTTTTYFEESNKVLVFEDLTMSGSIYRLRHVGNSTGTNHFQLGTTSGTGVDQAGASGGVIQSAGVVPFRIEATDANVDAVNYYGVTLLGPSAGIYNDAARTAFRSAPGFTDITRDFNDAGVNDASPFPSPAVNDAFYVGHDERFYNITIDVGTAKTGTYTIVWEYWDGAAYSALTDLTDGTNGFTTTGPNTVTYSIPDDWATVAVNSVTRYWIRARISAFTSTGTVPLIDEGSVGMIGDIRLEDPNVDMVGCTLANMGSIRVRNGAFLKKTTIGASTTPAKHAAVDLGSADPASDTVRDLTIQNCSKGVLLKGTSAGTTTYNITNFAFSGNTNDFRVDFPVGATVVINLTGCTSDTALISGNQDNVNSSTLTINNNVGLDITVQNAAGDLLSGAEVYLAQGDGTLIQDWTATDELGVVSTTVAASLGAILYRVRQSANTAQVASRSVDQLTTTATHKFQTGDAVVWDETNGSMTELTAGTTYYVEVINTTVVEMYTTAALAIAAGGGITLGAITANPELNPVRYINNSATGTVGATAFAATITLVVDSIAKDTI